MYTVPIISSDLRHEEAIIQAANALEYLQNTIDHIFDQIDRRIQKSNNQILELHKRISSANSKIENLIGSKKAIQIFSPSKFPAVHVFKDIPITFTHCSNSEFKLKTEYAVESNQESITQNSLHEKLVFFHVRTKQLENSHLAKISENKDGLGSIPYGIKSVNSLLLHNTTDNVYRRFKRDDPQIQQRISNEDKSDSARQPIEAAPLSITNRQKVSDKKFQQKLFYTPKLNDAPEINLPVDLPDLPGIAGDVHFNFLEKEKIAPSFAEFFANLPVPRISESIENIQIAADISPVSLDELICKKEESKKEIGVIQDSKPLPLSAPPPPPPPPLPIASKPDDTKKKLAESIIKTSTRLSGDTNGRSNLMEAIRKAGGTRGGKLRAAADVVRDNSTEDNIYKSKKTTGNLMDDLHNKLLMRRKGISGAKDTENNGNVIERLSSLIPPPTKPKRNLNSSASDDNDEWD